MNWIKNPKDKHGPFILSLGKSLQSRISTVSLAMQLNEQVPGIVFRREGTSDTGFWPEKRLWDCEIWRLDGWQHSEVRGVGVSALPEGDSVLGQIVRCQLHGHGVAPKDPDVMLAHFPRDVGDDFILVLRLYPELGVGEEGRLGRRSHASALMERTQKFDPRSWLDFIFCVGKLRKTVGTGIDAERNVLGLPRYPFFSSLPK